MKKPERLYRCDVTYAPSGSKLLCVEVEFIELTVEKRTEKGAWVCGCEPPRRRRFVLDSARKRYAYPTKSAALESLVARKSRQIEILKYKLKVAETSLSAAKKMQERGVRDTCSGGV